MKAIGKKTNEWFTARAKLIMEAAIEGRIHLIGKNVFGICDDCKKYKKLTPDHRVKRSQGGSHDKSNIDWVCIKCHDLRDNMGDPKNKKPKSKKADWSKPHKCKNCKAEVSALLCPHCGKISV